MGIITDINTKKKRALDNSLKKNLKERYPDDWKEIVKCIEEKIETGLDGQALEDAIDSCLQGIAAVSVADRTELKKIPRSHITIGG